MAKKEEVKKVEVSKREYVFTHPKKLFRIGVLGVQFIDGRYSTDDRSLAVQIINYEGVECISNP